VAEGAVAGIDWASEVHAACVMDSGGLVTWRFSFTHDAAAIRAMVRRLASAGVAGVAIERGDGPVVEELLAAGLAVFVVPSRQVKGLRTRYGSAGTRTTCSMPTCWRTRCAPTGTGGRRCGLIPGRPGRWRALCRSRKDLAETRVQVLGQLRASLELAFPGAVGLFTKPGSAISLAFLRRFPTAGKAAWLSPRRLAGWLSSVGYTGGVSAGILHGRLAAAAPGLSGAEGEARGQITLAFAVMTAALNEQIAVLDAEIGRLFAAHPDQHILSSLPRSGMIRAATLLAEIGGLPAVVPHRRRPRRARRGVPVDPAVRQAQPGGVPLVVQ
jgi:transposase